MEISILAKASKENQHIKCENIDFSWGIQQKSMKIAETAVLYQKNQKKLKKNQKMLILSQKNQKNKEIHTLVGRFKDFFVFFAFLVQYNTFAWNDWFFLVQYSKNEGLSFKN